MDSWILKYDSVEISLEGTPVVKNLSFSVKQGEILAIVGESGSGKSTILRAACGLLPRGWQVTRGQIWLQDQNLPSLTEKQMQPIRQKEISMIFQDCGASFCPVRTIGSQFNECLGLRGMARRKAGRQKALQVLAQLDFKDPGRILDSYPFQLSGGMNQRAAIALAMLMNPKVLLADEPTSALDPVIQKQVLSQLLLLPRKQHAALLMVTHDLGTAAAMADRILVLKDGELEEQGSARQILTHPEKEYTRQLLEAVPRLKRRMN